MTDVAKLPISFKEPFDPKEGNQLRTDEFGLDGKCNHLWKSVPTGDGAFLSAKIVDVHYVIRAGETEVECGICGTKLDPMWVLKKLAGMETRWRQTLERYQESMERLSTRKKTKCENCGRMTRISYTKPARKRRTEPDPPPRPEIPPDAG